MGFSGLKLTDEQIAQCTLYPTDLADGRECASLADTELAVSLEVDRDRYVRALVGSWCEATGAQAPVSLPAYRQFLETDLQDLDPHIRAAAKATCYLRNGKVPEITSLMRAANYRILRSAHALAVLEEQPCDRCGQPGDLFCDCPQPLRDDLEDAVRHDCEQPHRRALDAEDR